MTTDVEQRGQARPLPPTDRGRRSRQSLLDAAKQVFGTHGFADARIIDITNAAGAASGSFYTYFSSKEEIFIALLRELEDELRSPGGSASNNPAANDQAANDQAADDQAGDDSAADPYERILRANRTYLTAYRANASIMVAWEQVATLNPEVELLRREAAERFTSRIEAAISDWRADGLVSAAIDPATAAPALTGMVSTFAYRRLAAGSDHELTRAVEQLSRLWAGALGLPTPD